MYMFGRGKEDEPEPEEDESESRFNLLEKYSLSIGFLLTAVLLVEGQLPDYNPFIFFVFGPIAFRLLIDLAFKQTLGAQIIRDIHPKIIAVDTVVIMGGLLLLYDAGYWTLADLSPLLDAFSALSEQLGLVDPVEAANQTGQ